MNCSTKQYQLHSDTLTPRDHLDNRCEWSTSFKYDDEYIKKISCSSKYGTLVQIEIILFEKKEFNLFKSGKFDNIDVFYSWAIIFRTITMT